MRPESYRLDRYDKNINPHYLRHCRLSHYADHGLDILDLMYVAGWSTPNMASIYVRRDIGRSAKKLFSIQKTPLKEVS